MEEINNKIKRDFLNDEIKTDNKKLIRIKISFLRKILSKILKKVMKIRKMKLIIIILYQIIINYHMTKKTL